MELKAGPRERHRDPALRVGVADQAERVQRRVEQGRVQQEPVRAGRPGGQRHVGEDLVAPPPRPSEPLEDRTVVVAGGAQAVVETRRVQRCRARRRPDPQPGGVTGPHRRDRPGRVRGPRSVGAARVDRQRTRSADLRLGEDHPGLDDAGLREHQRGLQQQLDHLGAPGVVTGPRRQLRQQRSRHDDGTTDPVVGEPRLRGDRQLTGQQQPAPARRRRHLDRFPEQRPDRRRQPVPPTLERIGGQLHVRAGPADHGGPVDVHARDEEAGQRLPCRIRLVASGAQQRHGDRPATGGVGGVQVVDAVEDHGGEHAPGTDLQEPGHPLVAEPAHALGEPHRLPYVPAPVPRGDRVDRAPRLVGDQGDLQRRVGELRLQRAELRQHRVHQRGVERVADPQAGGLAAPGGERVGHRPDRVLRAGDHDRGRAVDGGETDPRRRVGDQRLDLVRGGLDRDHRAAGGQFLHHPATRDDQPGGVVQRQRARHVRGGDLADRVAEDDVRPDPPVPQQVVQRHLHGEQRRLGVPGPVQQVRVVEDGPDRTVQVPVQRGADLVESRREPWFGRGQVPSRRRPLRPLPGEDQGQPSLGGRAGDHRRGIPSGGERGEAVPVGHDGPSLEPGTRGGGRRHRAERQVRPVGEEGVEPPGLLVEGGLGPRGEHQRPGRRRAAGRSRLVRRLLQDHVGVGAADPEGGDRRAARRGPARPGLLLGEQAQRAGRPVHERGRFVDVQRAGQPPVPQREHHLDHAGHAGRRLGVTDVGLDRPEPERVLPSGAVRGQQRLGLDRVAEPCSGAVSLDRVHVGRRESRVGEGVGDQSLLRRAVRGGQPVGRPVGVDRAAPQDRQDVPTVPAGVGETFEDQHPGALGPPGPVGRRRERPAPSVGGEAALAAELGEDQRCPEHGHPTGQREGALPGT